MLYLGLTSFLFLLRFALAGQGTARNQLYFIVLASLFVFSAFRYQVGCDWSGYYYQYLGAADFDWSSVTKIREPIWWAILGWIQNMGLPYPVANIASSAVFFLGVHVLARRQPDPLGFLVLTVSHSDYQHANVWYPPRCGNRAFVHCLRGIHRSASFEVCVLGSVGCGLPY